MGVQALHADAGPPDPAGRTRADVVGREERVALDRRALVHDRQRVEAEFGLDPVDATGVLERADGAAEIGIDEPEAGRHRGPVVEQRRVGDDRGATVAGTGSHGERGTRAASEAFLDVLAIGVGAEVGGRIDVAGITVDLDVEDQVGTRRDEFTRTGIALGRHEAPHLTSDAHRRATTDIEARNGDRRVGCGDGRPHRRMDRRLVTEPDDHGIVGVFGRNGERPLEAGRLPVGPALVADHRDRRRRLGERDHRGDVDRAPHHDHLVEAGRRRRRQRRPEHRTGAPRRQQLVGRAVEARSGPGGQQHSGDRHRRRRYHRPARENPGQRGRRASWISESQDDGRSSPQAPPASASRPHRRSPTRACSWRCAAGTPTGSTPPSPHSAPTRSASSPTSPNPTVPCRSPSRPRIASAARSTSWSPTPEAPRRAFPPPPRSTTIAPPSSSTPCPPSHWCTP